MNLFGPILAWLMASPILIGGGVSPVEASENRSVSSPSVPDRSEDEVLVDCPADSGLAVKVYRDSRGEWVTTFSARNKLGNDTRSVDVDVENGIHECGESRYMTVKGYMKDMGAYYNLTESTAVDHGDNAFSGINGCCWRSSKLLKADMSELNDTLSGKLTEAMKKSSENLVNALSDFDRAVQENRTSFQKDLTVIQETLNYLKESQKTFQETLNSFTKRFTSLESTLNTIQNNVGRLEKNLEAIPTPCEIEFDPIHKGKNVAVSSDRKTAHRINPSDYEYGGVITRKPLKDGQLFEVRIEETLSLSRHDGISFGVIYTDIDKSLVKDARSIFFRIKGTAGIFSLANTDVGKSIGFINTVQQSDTYTFETRELKVGVRLGLMRKCNGALQYFLNGEDKGEYFLNVPKNPYVYFDILREVTKIRILS